MEIGPDKYKRGGGSLNQRGPKSCEIHYRGEEVQISYKVLEIFNISQVLSSLMSVLQDLIILKLFVNVYPSQVLEGSSPLKNGNLPSSYGGPGI